MPDDDDDDDKKQDSIWTRHESCIIAVGVVVIAVIVVLLIYSFRECYTSKNKQRLGRQMAMTLNAEDAFCVIQMISLYNIA